MAGLEEIGVVLEHTTCIGLKSPEDRQTAEALIHSQIFNQQSLVLYAQISIQHKADEWRFLLFLAEK
jgi:hypothetical protein